MNQKKYEEIMESIEDSESDVYAHKDAIEKISMSILDMMSDRFLLGVRVTSENKHILVDAILSTFDNTLDRGIDKAGIAFVEFLVSPILLMFGYDERCIEVFANNEDSHKNSRDIAKMTSVGEKEFRILSGLVVSLGMLIERTKTYDKTEMTFRASYISALNVVDLLRKERDSRYRETMLPIVEDMTEGNIKKAAYKQARKVLEEIQADFLSFIKRQAEGREEFEEAIDLLVSYAEEDEGPFYDKARKNDKYQIAVDIYKISTYAMVILLAIQTLGDDGKIKFKQVHFSQ